MTPTDLHEIRKRLRLSQTEMAEMIGLTLRPYQSIERGESPLLPRHTLAIERVALRVAVELKDPTLAPESVRRDAVALAGMVISSDPSISQASRDKNDH